MSKTVSGKQKSKALAAALRIWNMWLAAIYLLQGVFILLLSATRLFPVETTYLTRDPIGSELAGHQVLAGAAKHLFDLNLAYVIATILFAAAIMHLLVATVYRQQYEAGLAKGVNKARWIEYSLGGGLLFVAIGALVGVTNIATLLLLFGVAVMTGLSQMGLEFYRSQSSAKNAPNRLFAGISIGAGALLWLVIAIVMWGAGVFGSGGLPGFVYVLAGSTLVFCLAFGTLLLMQYRKAGKGADYLQAERAFMALSLITKTVLVWQIVAGALRT